MKKIIFSLLFVLCFLVAIMPVIAASVTPISIMGNDICAYKAL